MKVNSKQYALSLYQSLEGKNKIETQDIIKRFVEILHRNNDISKTQKIIELFEKTWDRERGIVEVEIISAKDLSQETIKLLDNYIANITNNKEVVSKNKIDKGIIGGVVIKYGDRILDGSIKTKISELKNKIIK